MMSSLVKLRKDIEEQSCVRSEPATSANYTPLNVLGIIGAICSLTMTIFIYVTTALGTNTVSA